MGRVGEPGVRVIDVETLDQARIDSAVRRSDYRYYDLATIHRCVTSERALIRDTGAQLVVHDFKPTAALSARLEGVDDARITQAYNQPHYRFRLELPVRFEQEAGPFSTYLAQHAREVHAQRSLSLLADIPAFHPPAPGAVGYYYVGPLLWKQPDRAEVPELDEGWDRTQPLIYVTCGSSGRPPEYLDELISKAQDLPLRFVITTAGRWRCGFATIFCRPTLGAECPRSPEAGSVAARTSSPSAKPPTPATR